MKTRTPRVFIPQEPRKRDITTQQWQPLYDLSPALQFGTLEVLTPHGPTLLDTGGMIEDMKHRMVDFCDDDYILCIGDPSAMAAAILVAGKINRGSITLLKFDRNTKRYNPIKFQA